MDDHESNAVFPLELPQVGFEPFHLRIFHVAQTNVVLPRASLGVGFALGP